MLTSNLPVISVDLVDVILHPDIVINIRTMGATRVADLHIKKIPVARNTEQFDIHVDQHRITLTKEMTRQSIIDFLRAFRIPFKLL